MDWTVITWSQCMAIGTVLLTVWFSSSCVFGGVDDECPDDYWDEPSKTCSHPLVSALEQLTPDEDWASDLRVNRTCILWVQTDTCYQKLMRQCRQSSKSVHELQQHLDRYWIYSLTCSRDQLKQRRSLVECFVPHLKPTHSCTEAFEKYFRNFAAEKHFKNACRVVSIAMKCFHEIKKQIGGRCPRDAPGRYQQLYITPLIEQTRNTVLTKCSLSAPYDQYFSRAPTIPVYRTSYALVALLFARWRPQLVL